MLRCWHQSDYRVDIHMLMFLQPKQGKSQCLSCTKTVVGIDILLDPSTKANLIWKSDIKFCSCPKGALDPNIEDTFLTYSVGNRYCSCPIPTSQTSDITTEYPLTYNSSTRTCQCPYGPITNSTVQTPILWNSTLGMCKCTVLAITLGYQTNPIIDVSQEERKYEDRSSRWKWSPEERIGQKMWCRVRAGTEKRGWQLKVLLESGINWNRGSRTDTFILRPSNNHIHFPCSVGDSSGRTGTSVASTSQYQSHFSSNKSRVRTFAL